MDALLKRRMGMAAMNAEDIMATILVSDISTPTTLFSYTGVSLFDYIKIDGVKISPAYSYQFSSTGEHSVSFKFKEPIGFVASLFNGRSYTKFAFGKSIESITGNLSFSNIATSVVPRCDVSFSHKLKSIDATVFRYSSAIVLTELPESLESIGGFAFDYCTSIPYLHVLPKSVPQLGSEAFHATSFKLYVGGGKSAEADDAILALYLADSGWAAYSSRLDTWYNYLNS